jgi:hypothetical protein
VVTFSTALFMQLVPLDNQTDSQQFLPIIMPLVLSVYVGFFSVMNDPHGL